MNLRPHIATTESRSTAGPSAGPALWVWTNDQGREPAITGARRGPTAPQPSAWLRWDRGEGPVQGRTQLALHKGSRPALCLDLGWPWACCPTLPSGGWDLRLGRARRSCRQSRGGRQGTGGARCSAALTVTFGRRQAWAHLACECCQRQRVLPGASGRIRAISWAEEAARDCAGRAGASAGAHRAASSSCRGWGGGHPWTLNTPPHHMLGQS